MEIVHVKEAVGMALCHDITRIVPGKFKGRAFKRGHVIRNEDLQELLDLGKEYVYVWDLSQGYVHEDDAACRIAKAVSGFGIDMTEPVEGKVEMIASVDGFLRIDKDLLYDLNMIDNIAIATIHGGQVVKRGKTLAGTRIIPLVIEDSVLLDLERRCGKPVIEIVPFRHWKIGLIVTGSEVFYGRIEDRFAPVIHRKMDELNGTIIKTAYVSDSIEMTTEAIADMLSLGADMVVLTGGMSVDPDDQTPASIRAAGGRTVVYGAPVLPGSMFMLAYIGDIPVIGLTGCVMYHQASIFDLVVPRIMAGEAITKEELAKMSHGGFCLRCAHCVYPDCSFGK